MAQHGHSEQSAAIHLHTQQALYALTPPHHSQLCIYLVKVAQIFPASETSTLRTDYSLACKYNPHLTSPFMAFKFYGCEYFWRQLDVQIKKMTTNTNSGYSLGIYIDSIIGSLKNYIQHVCHYREELLQYMNIVF